MFKLVILDHNFTLLSGYPNEVRQLLTYQSKIYNPRLKKMKFDLHSLIDYDNSTTYTGLVDYIVSNYPPDEFEDRRTFPNNPFRVPKLSVELRKYQIDYLLAALQKKRLIVHCDGGSGKTAMMAAILDALDLRTMIIAPNKSILGQLETELKKLLPRTNFGLAYNGKIDLKYQIIGTAKTLSKLPPSELQKFKAVLVDEAHTAAAKQTHDLIMSTNAPYRIGFTASPEGRSDNRDLVVQGLLGEPVKLVERQELIAGGFLADIAVNMHRGAWNGDYKTLEDLLIVNNPKRNELIYQMVKNYKSSSILILVRRLDHGKILSSNIRDSVFLSGDDDLKDREQIRDAMKSGRVKVVIATKIFGTGIDIPNLEVCINARGGKSDIDTIQGSARLNRPWKDLFKVFIDIYDDWHPTLEAHSKERLDVYYRQGINVDLINFPPGKQKLLEMMADEYGNSP